MTKTDAIIWKRIEERAYRMASNEKIAHSTEAELKCWDAHCYKYIDTSGKVNYILSQEEFDKLKFIVSLKQNIFEVLYCNNNKIPRNIKSMLEFIFNPEIPNFQVLENLFCISPMWDDREKKKP